MTGPERQSPEAAPAGAARRSFPTTHWSSVFLAADKSTDGARALEALCMTYWPALYAYVRRQNRSVEEAEDLTQEFFRRLLENRSFASADPARGRFRSFLLKSLRNFLADEWKRAQREKYGGKFSFISYEGADLEEIYEDVRVLDATPEVLYECAWARALLRQVIAQLENEFRRAGQRLQFEELRPFLEGDGRGDSYRIVAERSGASEAAVRSTIYRMRQRYASLVKERVATLVGGPEEVEDELRHLLEVLQTTSVAAA